MKKKTFLLYEQLATKGRFYSNKKKLFYVLTRKRGHAEIRGVKII